MIHLKSASDSTENGEYSNRGGTYEHRTLPPNIPGDIQGILAIYPKYTANIPGGEYTPNIPQSIQTGDDSSTSMVT